MDSARVTRLRNASAAMAAVDELVDALREQGELLRSIASTDASREAAVADLLRSAVRTLGQSAAGGRAYLLAKATVLAAASVRDEGAEESEALCDALEATVTLDPELPARVADAERAYDALARAVRVLVEHRSNEQQLWLPHVHEALLELQLVEGGVHATRMSLSRAHERAIDRADPRGRHRLLHLLSE